MDAIINTYQGSEHIGTPYVLQGAYAKYHKYRTKDELRQQLRPLSTNYIRSEVPNLETADDELNHLFWCFEGTETALILLGCRLCKKILRAVFHRLFSLLTKSNYEKPLRAPRALILTKKLMLKVGALRRMVFPHVPWPIDPRLNYPDFNKVLRVN